MGRGIVRSPLGGLSPTGRHSVPDIVSGEWNDAGHMAPGRFQPPTGDRPVPQPKGTHVDWTCRTGASQSVYGFIPFSTSVKSEGQKNALFLGNQISCPHDIIKERRPHSFICTKVVRDKTSREERVSFSDQGKEYFHVRYPCFTGNIR